MQIFALIILLSFISGYAQNPQTINHAFHNAFVFGLDGGVTLPQTDYQKIKMGYSFRAVSEYFFKTNSSHLFGLKFKFGSEEIGGEDSRPSILTAYGLQEIPPGFTTSILSAGLSLAYSISVNEVFFPYLSVGVSNLWIDPKDDQNKPAVGNTAGLYNKSVRAYDFEFGLRYLISDRLSLNITANQYIPLTDYMDDVATGNKNDSYTSLLLGFSFSPFFDNDPDGDGIAGKYDHCPNQPEDFDNFKDEDGCPDYDNDSDGIIDVNDKCPDEVEDFDSFKDEDGCPDYDNDSDGILDIKDHCPNQPEDFDGFKDEDGCPDYDNDGDGILDIQDKCPDQHETINDFEDEDGCPDTVPFGYIPERFNMQADSVFFKGSYKLRSEIKSHLDEIITMIKQLPHAIWRIEVHMDSFGHEREIQVLSLERARAVLEYFVDFGGLPPEKFRIFGLGDKFPIGDNKTEEGRAKNRRILIIKE